ncbi:MAG: YbaB/EbfC family nucleoid-associated protein [Endomicrobium sp.]|jgi:DNA-binding protein YbaB|nr:YbaB/EbfC family nucleoid-associated protein [Endomicrobium sp.]
MELFKMAKEALSMRSKINEIDKKLRANIITIEHKGIQIQVNGKNEFLSLVIPENLLTQTKTKIEKYILEAFCEAHNKSQTIMTEEAKKLTGSMKLPI